MRHSRQDTYHRHWSMVILPKLSFNVPRCLFVFHPELYLLYSYSIDSAMVSILALSMIYRGMCQIKDYKIDICCFSSKHAALRRKSQDLIGSESGYYVEVERLVFLWIVVAVSCKITTKRVDLLHSIIIISSKCTLLLPWYSRKIAPFAFNNNHSLTHSICQDV